MAKITPKMLISGGKNMSQRDAMQATMQKAYKNTQVFGMPTKRMPKGAALKSAAIKAASKLLGGRK